MATADNPREEFDNQFLTCDICKEIYEDPRFLPCHHTFCTKCLEGLHQSLTQGQQLTCPVCRVQVRLGENGVSDLQANFDINRLMGFMDHLTFMDQQSSKRARLSCQSCETAAIIEGTCGNCHFLLCKNCITAHRNILALKDHHILTLDDMKNPSSRSQYTQVKNCPKHRDQRMTFYCTPCTKFVCQDCTQNEHKPGPESNHNPQEVGKVAQEVKVELQTLVATAQDRNNTLKKTKSSVTKDVSSITTNCEKEKEKIQKHFAQLRTKLNKEEKKLTKKLEEIGKQQKKPLQKELTSLKRFIKTTEDGLKVCMDTLARDNDVEILKRSQQLRKRLNCTGYVSHKLPHCVRFAPNSEMLTSSLGSFFEFTKIPVESLATYSVIIRPQVDQVQGTPQITVTSMGRQHTILNTTETSEGVFKAVWRPQTSGKHVVGMIAEGGGEIMKGGGNLCSHLTIYVGSNNPVLRFGQKGSQQGQFDTPLDVAVRGDRLYVADYGNQRVQVFDLIGNFCFLFSTTTNPESVAVQTDGTIIVVRSGLEVTKFSPSGEPTNTFSLGDYCENPWGLAVQRDGRVVVADQDKRSIFLFEADGTLVKQVGGKGKGEEEGEEDRDDEEEEEEEVGEEDKEGERDGNEEEVEEEVGEKDDDDEEEEAKGQFDEPCFVSVDKEDNIIVSDENNHCVQVFDKNLNFKHKFGQKGREPQDMWDPMGVSADGRGNIVLANLAIGGITDGTKFGQKIQVFCKNGNWVSTISSDGDKLNEPHGVAVTEDRHVFVADAGDHCIRKYRYM